MTKEALQNNCMHISIRQDWLCVRWLYCQQKYHKYILPPLFERLLKFIDLSAILENLGCETTGQMVIRMYVTYQQMLTQSSILGLHHHHCRPSLQKYT